mmetsp:Transcript_98742/g.279164  ORF Transcript_98742/g.279164 Transcript_98742/m.279164 type:complete len:215 (-) Transcript_98742:853-1497(-)
MREGPRHIIGRVGGKYGRNAGRSIACASKPTVERRPQHFREDALQQTIGQKANLIGDVPTKKEESQGVTEMIAIVRENVVSVISEQAFDPMNKVSVHLAPRAQGHAQAEHLGGLPEIGSAGVVDLDPSLEIVLLPEDDQTCVPKPIFQMAEKQRCQKSRASLRHVIIVELDWRGFEADLLGAELGVRKGLANVSAHPFTQSVEHAFTIARLQRR